MNTRFYTEGLFVEGSFSTYFFTANEEERLVSITVREIQENSQLQTERYIGKGLRGLTKFFLEVLMATERLSIVS